MKSFALFVTLLFAAPASAEIFEVEIPDGPALNKFNAICAVLLVDRGIPISECAKHFLINGAREYNHQIATEEKIRQAQAAIAAATDDFDAVLPLLPRPIDAN